MEIFRKMYVLFWGWCLLQQLRIYSDRHCMNFSHNFLWQKKRLLFLYPRLRNAPMFIHSLSILHWVFALPTITRSLSHQMIVLQCFQLIFFYQFPTINFIWGFFRINLYLYTSESKILIKCTCWPPHLHKSQNISATYHIQAIWNFL